MCLQEYERRFQSLFDDYSGLQQKHKQQTSELEVLSRVGAIQPGTCHPRLCSGACSEHPTHGTLQTGASRQDQDLPDTMIGLPSLL